MKIDNGIHVETVGLKRVEIEGRLDGRSPVRVILEYQQEAIIQVVSVPMLNFKKYRQLINIMNGVFDSIELAQRELDRVNADATPQADGSG